MIATEDDRPIKAMDYISKAVTETFQGYTSNFAVYQPTSLITIIGSEDGTVEITSWTMDEVSVLCCDLQPRPGRAISSTRVVKTLCTDSACVPCSKATHPVSKGEMKNTDYIPFSKSVLLALENQAIAHGVVAHVWRQPYLDSELTLLGFLVDSRDSLLLSEWDWFLSSSFHTPDPIRLAPAPCVRFRPLHRWKLEVRQQHSAG